MITHRSEKCKNGVDCKTQINGVIYSVVNQLTFHQQFWYQLGIRIPNCELKCGVGEDSWESWTARISNQSILKEISPEYSSEGLMLKLKLQYFGHVMHKTDSLERTLMLGKIESRRRRGWQRMRWLDVITKSTDRNLSKLQDLVMNREAWHAAGHGVTKSQTLLSDWTELKYKLYSI